MSRDSRKGRGALVAKGAVGLFLAFTIAALSLNFLLSWRIERQAVAINIAGRQRMLSQRMVKALLEVQAARATGADHREYLDELRLSFDLFDNTLRGFDAGHETRGGTGEALFLSAVTRPGARAAVDQAQEIWEPYRAQIVKVLAADQAADNATVGSLVECARANNLRLLDLMNELTTELEGQAQHEAHLIRVYQAVASLLALISFVCAVVLFRRRDDEILRAQEGMRKLSRAVEHSPATVVITDRQGTIEYVNPAFTEVTGYTTEEAIGQNPKVLKSGELSDEVYANLWQTISTGETWRGELCNRKKSGELF
jgi:PAS domain S-box-containing protein